MVRDNKKIIKNSLYIYGRLIFTMLITLYTSRIILQQLGVENYGTYNVIAGITVMFASIRALFASALQRFYNFEIGRSNNIESLNKIFNIGLLFHLAGALFLVLILEPMGYWLINYQLNIPDANRDVAFTIFQMTVISTVLAMLSVPYDALVIAREKMAFYAGLSIFDSVLKLFIALSLSFIFAHKLTVYSILILFIATLNFIILIIYSHKKFSYECHIRIVWDVKLVKEISRFAGWNFFGNISYSLTNEILNFILNIFGGVAANAARGIAYQVRGAVHSLISNSLIAVRPQATQEYANGNIESFYKIIYFASKTVFFFALVVVTPIFVYSEDIIFLWLGSIPPYSSIFVAITMIQLLIRSLHGPIDLIFKSSGHLKYYQLTSFFISIIGIPIIFWGQKLGLNIYYVFIGMCLMEFFEIIIIVFMAAKEGLNLKLYFYDVIWPALRVSLLTIILSFGIKSLGNIWVGVPMLVISIAISIAFGGYSSNERKMVLNNICFLKKKTVL